METHDRRIKRSMAAVNKSLELQGMNETHNWQDSDPEIWEKLNQIADRQGRLITHQENTTNEIDRLRETIPRIYELVGDQGRKLAELQVGGSASAVNALRKIDTLAIDLATMDVQVRRADEMFKFLGERLTRIEREMITETRMIDIERSWAINLKNGEKMFSLLIKILLAGAPLMLAAMWFLANHKSLGFG